MLITIPAVLNANEVAEARSALDAADWVDGKVTAGYQAQTVKENLQLPEGHPVAVKLGETVLGALARSPLFMSVALPLRVSSPLCSIATLAADISALMWIPQFAPWFNGAAHSHRYFGYIVSCRA